MMNNFWINKWFYWKYPHSKSPLFILEMYNAEIQNVIVKSKMGMCNISVFNVYYLNVCLHVCEHVYSLFAPCHLAEMDSRSQLARRALSSAISWRNKETTIRAPWREGSVACSPLRGFISTRELFWQNHWIGCRSQIPGTSNQDRFPVHPQTT